jgi:hypothetical protein
VFTAAKAPTVPSRMRAVVLAAVDMMRLSLKSMCLVGQDELLQDLVVCYDRLVCCCSYTRLLDLEIHWEFLGFYVLGKLQVRCCDFRGSWRCGSTAESRGVIFWRKAPKSANVAEHNFDSLHLPFWNAGNLLRSLSSGETVRHHERGED